MRTAISQALGHTPADPLIPISGGCIHECYRWGPYFIKTNSRDHQANFHAEATALQSIATTGTIRVPEFVTHGTSNNNAFLVLEFLELHPSGDEALLGDQLAALHRHEADQFGFPEPNFIGATPQPNPWTDDWPSFFREHRIGHLLELLERQGIRFPTASRLLDSLPDILPTKPRTSLLHGDLWAGNKAFLADGTPLIFDPACYHGHAACDLAMTRLFGGFSRRFYDAYRSSSQLDDPSIHEIYNLYHVLNHALLFGGRYVDQAREIILRLS